MEVFDLTHYMNNEMPVFPGTGRPHFAIVNTYETDGFQETMMKMTTHTGTHMDAPRHLYADRTSMEQFPISQFIGKALVIDVRDLNEGDAITLERITRYGAKAEEADFLLFNLGWDQKWGTDDYFGDYPCLDEEALDYIIAGDYKGIGFDVIGLDPVKDVELVRHNKLFKEKDILNIENLRGLDELVDEFGDELINFSCFPLKLTECDGSPIRAVAWR